MATNTIPDSVDCIIIGTGLTNSIIAAACSRIGKSVLHVDKNCYYGDVWASFTFQQLVDWVKSNYPDDECLNSIPSELINKSRLFCIDLCPRLLYSNGTMVDLLVKSNVSRYHEFKNTIRILSMVGDDIHVMPCQRSDVFTSPLLSDLVDKRRLMKFIELCIKFDPEKDTAENSEIIQHANEPISEFLEERGLKYPLREYIINSIAMVKPTDSVREACVKIKKFMIAIERFGRSPFLFPLYGCGEFPQSFCRLSAVFGGIYCLSTQVDNVEISNNKASDVDDLTPPPIKKSTNSASENFAIKFSNSESKVKSAMLVVDCTSAIDLNLTNIPKMCDKLSRAILITKKSIVPNSDNLTSFMRIPPSDKNANFVYLLEFNSSMMVCPPDISIVYLWTKASSPPEGETDAKLDLFPTVERIFGNDISESIVWSFYYHQLCGSEYEPVDTTGSNGLHITSPPSNDIDYEHNIKEAELIFSRMCPDQEFLPRAPDPDEIIT